MSTVHSANGPDASPRDTSRTYGNFDFVTRVEPDYGNVVVEKWRSRVTGLSVVHVDYEAPIVKGYFAVATEIFDDTGCPHTLEHLVFLGSEKYPYKGVLDNLANRAFAEGTNAWTDQDQTVYTIDTAGGQGFLQLLPVYVDHLLYPTLTSSGFVTEVHHVNSKGEDAGVVYSEMQGRENTPGDLLALRSQRAFYPNGNAYRSETAGLMEALRVLSIDEIRHYHSTYYVPHNLCLIVTGKLSTPALLEVLQSSVEPRIISHGQANGPRPAGWKRPFLETPTARRVDLGSGTREVVEFPEKDESMGEVSISFVGPPPTAFLEQKALELLGTYLTDSPVSPLTREYVETESPLCTSIYIGDTMRAGQTTLDVYFSSVPTEQLETCESRLVESLTRIVEEGLDMERMKMVIDRDRRKLVNSLETSPSEVFLSSVIDDFLYGDPSGKDLADSLDESKRYAALEIYTSEQWCDLLRRYFIGPPRVVMLGKPSADLAQKLETDENTRVADQQKKLGEDGLARLGKELEDAKMSNDRPIPPEMLTSFPLPDVSTVPWIPVQSAQNDPFKGGLHVSQPSDLEDLLRKDSQQLPFFLEFDHVNSKFVTVSAYLSTAKLPEELRAYVTVYLTSFFSLPVERADGTKLSHEEVVNQLDAGTVAYDADIIAPFSQLIRVTLKVEPSRYSEAISWLRDLLYSAVFDIERVKITVAKIQQGLPALKRDGNVVLDSIHGSLVFDETSTAVAAGILPQIQFIRELVEELEESPDDVIQDLKDFRKHITDPKAVRFSVYGNVLALDKPRTAWSQNFRTLPKTKLLPVPWTQHSLSPLGRHTKTKATVVTLPTIESSYAMHTTNAVGSFDHPDYPALRVATEVLDGMESYLWRFIRGAGLAYGANMSVDVESSLLTFSLYRSPDSFKAFQEAAKVIKALVDGTEAMEETSLDAAKSTLVYNFARKSSTVGKAALNSFTNQVFKGVPQNHHHTLLQRFQAVTKGDIMRAIRQYVLPLFEPKTSIAVVVSSPSKANDIADGLKGVGYDVERRELEFEIDDEGSEFSVSGEDSGEESGDGR